MTRIAKWIALCLFLSAAFGICLPAKANDPAALFNHIRAHVALGIGKFPQFIDADDPGAFEFQAEALLEFKQWKEADAAVKEALRLNPQSGDAHFIQGRIFQKTKNYEKAIESFSTSIEIENNYLCLLRRSACHLELGNRKEAIEDSTNALRSGPNDASCCKQAGILFAALDAPELAAQAFNQCLAITPRDSDALKERAFVLTKLGRVDDAIADLTKAIQLHPQADLYLSRGKLWLKKEEYKKAVADLTAYLDQNPNAINALRDRALCYFIVGKTQQAFSDLDKVIFLAPVAGDYYNRAMFFMEKKQYASAIADLDEAIRLEHTDLADTIALRAYAHHLLGHTLAAVADLTEALQIDPRCINALMTNGTVQYEIGNHEIAIDYFSKAMKRMPNNADIYFARGSSYLKNKQYSKAQEDFDTALRLDPLNTKAMWGHTKSRLKISIGGDIFR